MRDFQVRIARGVLGHKRYQTAFDSGPSGILLGEARVAVGSKLSLVLAKEQHRFPHWETIHSALAAEKSAPCDTPQFDTYRRVSDYITLDVQLSYEFRKPTIQPAAASLDPKSSEGAQLASIDHGNLFQRMLGAPN